MRFAAFVAMLVGCGAARAPEATSPSEAITYPSCGPTDGPARTILVFPGRADCANAERRDVAHLSLELWSPALLDSGEGLLEGSAGAAHACDATGECRPLSQARIALRNEPDGTTSGSVTYREGDRTVTRAFRASRCHVKFMCG